MSLYRAVDANINRVCEGIRVLEDISRFHFENTYTTKKLREFRHEVRKTFSSNELIYSRDSSGDVGRKISEVSTLDKKNTVDDIIKSNFKRAQEGLRTIEEILKILGNYEIGKKYEKLRFKSYELEKEMIKRKFIFKDSIYAILGEDFSNGKDNITVTKELVKNGIKVIQYREKNRDKNYKINQCLEIKKILQGTDVTFIVNDDIDIALAANADGVHLGQEDLKPVVVRNLNPNFIIGLSTHNKKQALEALELYYSNVIDYIGVGPMFDTNTKKNIEKSDGLNYLKWVSENINMPSVAIGGIKEENIKSVIENGGNCVAMISELVGASDITEKINSIRNVFSTSF